MKRPSKTGRKRIDAMRDEEIDFSEIPEQGAEFLQKRNLLAGTEEADYAAG
jgi:hypothetical protein